MVRHDQRRALAGPRSNSSMIIASTQRLKLRHFNICDGRAMDGVFGDAEVMRYGPGVQRPEWVRAWLRDCLEDYYQKWGFGLWAIVEKSKQQVIGYCGITYFPDLDGRPETELGYRLASPFWGRGYGTEAAIAVRDYAFETLCLPRLVAIVDPANTASIRIVEKVGMCYEKNVMLAGYSHFDSLYAIARPPMD